VRAIGVQQRRELIIKEEWLVLVPLSWLREYIDVDLTPDVLAEELNLTGTAVESIKKMSEGLENVRVGLLEEVKPHPDADKLSVTTVNIGRPEKLQIVCGAKNIKPGDKVPVAMIGAHLPNGVEIKAAKLRGVASQGMLCSQTELKIGSDTSGIYILPEDVEVGALFAEAMGLDDTVLELEITPNRPDCLSIIGMAREVGAITNKKYVKPEVSFAETPEDATKVASVDIIDEDLCPRYTARVIRDVKIGPSPMWMQQHLQKAGMRAINNIVDITNYVMLEMGQPLHAFDFAIIKGSKIIVRRAKNGEKLETLDGVVRELDETMLVIADTDRAVALAGVMGGADTEVSENTVDILLESAYFDPKSIMRTSRSLGLLSESSARFEKGIDPNGCIEAADRAAQLMADLAGGKVSKGIVDVYPKKIEPKKLPVRTNRVNSILGTNLSISQVQDIVERLEIKTEVVGGTSEMWAYAPTFRPDLEREIDLIEEIARVYGYNRIESTLPESGAKLGGLSREQKTTESIKMRLIAAGVSEVITYSFVDPADVDNLQVLDGDPYKWFVKLVNPLSEEQSVLRTTLLTGLLKVLKHNVNREQFDVQIFEIGHVFAMEEGKDLPQEDSMLGVVLSGAWKGDKWYGKARSIDYFDLKGVVEAVLEEIGIDGGSGEGWSVRSFTHPALHPGRSAELLIDDEPVGYFGELHPDAQAAFGLPKTYVAEISHSKLLKNAEDSKQYKEIPKYPGITLDIAVLVDDNMPQADLMEVIKSAGGSVLESVNLFDLYTGKGIPEGKKSLAYSMTFRALDRTLTDEEALNARGRILNKLAKEAGAEIRS
jgi:phenylalanyl-tRNA synthetase beta chain